MRKLQLALILAAAALVWALPARAAAQTIRGAWVDRWGDALAGGGVTIVGMTVPGVEPRGQS